MITNIEINNYRSITNLKIDSLSRFNLIVGPNNTGKTSFLEALLLYCAPVNFAIPFTLLSIRNGGFKANPFYLVNHMKWFFNNPSDSDNLELTIRGDYSGYRREVSFGLQKTIVVQSADKKIQGRIDGTSIVVDESIDIDGKNEDESVFSAGKIFLSFKSDKQELVESELNFPATGSISIAPPQIRTDIKAVYLDAQSHRNPEGGKDKYTQAVTQNYHDECVRLMKDIDPDIKEICLLTPNDGTPELYVKHKKLGLTPLSSLGDGLKRAYYIITSLAQCKDGALFIDEIEYAIHSNAMRELLSVLLKYSKKFNVQIFATTHSLEFIDVLIGCNKAISKDVCLYKFYRKDEKISSVVISGENLRSLRVELGQDVRW